MYIVCCIASSRINDECLVNDGVKMLTMTFVVVFLSILLYSTCVWMYNVDVCVYRYKAKSIDDDGSGGFLCCQTERTDKKKEIKEDFVPQR